LREPAAPPSFIIEGQRYSEYGMNLRTTLFIAAAFVATPALAQTSPMQSGAPATDPAPAQSSPAPSTAPSATPPAQGTTGAGAATASATTVSDTEVKQFATAALAVNKLQADTTTPEADKNAKLVAAITATGLSAERFNAIGQAMAGDPALNKRIQEAAAAAQKPAG
jgi:hypothetical protein